MKHPWWIRQQQVPRPGIGAPQQRLLRKCQRIFHSHLTETFHVQSLSWQTDPHSGWHSVMLPFDVSLGPTLADLHSALNDRTAPSNDFDSSDLRSMLLQLQNNYIPILAEPSFGQLLIDACNCEVIHLYVLPLYFTISCTIPLWYDLINL